MNPTPSAVGAPVVEGQTLMQRLVSANEAQWKIQEIAGRIFGIDSEDDILAIEWDWYDHSIEIYADEDGKDFTVTPEMSKQFKAETGCRQFWVNYPNGTQCCGAGERQPSGTWKHYNEHGGKSRFAPAPIPPAPVGVAEVEEAIKGKWRAEMLKNAGALMLANVTQREDEYGAGWNAAIAHLHAQVFTIAEINERDDRAMIGAKP